MAAFVYESFLQKQYLGFSTALPSWASFNLALVTAAYTPNQATDATIADIPGGAFAADGHTGTFPTFTPQINGSGAAPEAGIRLTLVTNSWGSIGAGPNVIAAVLYGFISGLTSQLIAYYDNWTGLPFTPNGTPVTIVSLPTPLQSNGVNMIRTTG
jgi:hypothetical protein